MIAKLKVLWVEKLKSGKSRQKKYTRFDFIQKQTQYKNAVM